MCIWVFAVYLYAYHSPNTFMSIKSFYYLKYFTVKKQNIIAFFWCCQNACVFCMADFVDYRNLKLNNLIQVLYQYFLPQYSFPS